MSESIAYFCGETIPASEARLPVYDLGVIQGVTFSEMTRSFGGVLFRAEDHIARLFRSLHYGGIEISLTPNELLEITHRVVENNIQFLEVGEDLAVVQFVTAGQNAMYSDGLPVRDEPTVCVHTFKLPFRRWRSIFENGAHCVVPETRHVPVQCVDPRTKNRSRMHWHLAEREAKKVDSQAIPLLLDLEGNITETPGANFLLFKGDTVFSPPPHSILGGISKQTVKEIAHEIGWNWVEKELQIHDALNADEAWLTSTPYAVAPCVRLNQAPIGDGKIGKAYARVLSIWSERVGCDIAAQILNS